MKKQCIQSALFVCLAVHMLFALTDTLLEAKLPGLQSSLPPHWTAWISNDPDSATTVPEGCFDPLFNVYFFNEIDTFYSSPNNSMHPELLLCFYDIKDEDTLVRAIDEYGFSSFMPPMEFYRTNRFMIITTPLFINGGCFNTSAQYYYDPLDKAIKIYLDSSDISETINSDRDKKVQRIGNGNIYYNLLGKKISVNNKIKTPYCILITTPAYANHARIVINHKKP